MCESIHGTLLDVVRACEECAEVSGTYIKRHWTLTQFYLTHLRSLAKPLLKDVCQPGSEAMTCRGLLRYFLFSIRRYSALIPCCSHVLSIVDIPILTKGSFYIPHVY